MLNLNFGKKKNIYIHMYLRSNVTPVEGAPILIFKYHSPQKKQYFLGKWLLLGLRPRK